MKLIFLDIDDVLNDKHTPNVPHNIPHLASKLRRDIDPKKVKLLNRIIEGAGGPDEVQIVLSSGWRVWYSDAQVQKFLDEKGFIGTIVDRTPLKMSFIPRQSEISLWFDLPVENRDEYMAVDLPDYFLILDNEKMDRIWGRHALKTTVDKGLDERHVAMGINILNTRPAKDFYARVRAAAKREERRMDAYLDRIALNRQQSPAAPAEKVPGPSGEPSPEW